ncbi:MucBP domain-containing protein [Enterococcus silesiacus]
MNKNIVLLAVSCLVFMNVAPSVNYAANVTTQGLEDPTIDNKSSDQLLPLEQDSALAESSTDTISSESTVQKELPEPQTNTSVESIEGAETDNDNQNQPNSTKDSAPIDYYTDSQSEQAEKTSLFADTVTIPDLNLRKLINKKLNHVSDWETYTPTKQELASIRGIFRLDFGTTTQTQFTSLEGIQYLTGISDLYAYYVTFMNLDDLNLISTLKQLTYISMGNTNIDSIAFATSLPNLTGMVLPNNYISDVSASLDYYNSPKRKQYNFTKQSITKTITLENGQTVVDPLAIIGINGNPVSVNYQNSTSHFKFENGKFIGNDLIPGQTYAIKYSFVDTSINHAGRLTGNATIDVQIPLIQGAEVTVKYEDTEGNELAPAEIFSGNLGETYTSEQLEIPGYTFKEVLGNASGEFTSEAQTVMYIYTKTPVKGADVTVKYEDTEGNELAVKVLSGNLGDPYTSEQLAIEEYVFKNIKGNPTGKFTAEAQKITYVYTKQTASGNHDKPDNSLDKKHQTQNSQANPNNSSKTGSTYQSTFPKTGEKQGLEKRLSILGSIIIILLTGLFIWNKHFLNNK